MYSVEMSEGILLYVSSVSAFSVLGKSGLVCNMREYIRSWVNFECALGIKVVGRRGGVNLLFLEESREG